MSMTNRVAKYLLTAIAGASLFGANACNNRSGNEKSNSALAKEKAPEVTDQKADLSTYKSYFEKRGDRIELSVEEKLVVTLTIESNGNKTEKVETSELSMMFDDEVLLVDEAEKTPIKIKRFCPKAVETKRGVSSEWSIHQKTVLIEKKGSEFRFSFVGGGEVIGPEQAFLDGEFSASYKRLLSREPLSPGDTWDPKSAFIEMITRRFDVSQDHVVCSGKLVKSATRSERRFSAYEISALAPVTMAKHPTEKALGPGSKIEVQATFDVCSDGSAPDGTSVRTVTLTWLPAKQAEGIKLSFKGVTTSTTKVRLLSLEEQGKREGKKEGNAGAAEVDTDEPEKLYRAGLDAYYGLTGVIDHVNALKLFEQAAARGHTLASARAGIMLYRGFGAAVDKVEGLKEIEVALPSVRRKAQNGDAEAQLLMGILSEKGLGVKKDEKVAFDWYHQAADKGNSPAMLNLGYLFSDGLGVDKNQQKGFEWINKAAEKGLANAMGSLGAMYVLGLGVDKDKKKGFEWVRKAAAKGEPPSIIYLFDLNVSGEVKLDRKETVKLTRKAADHGHAVAMLALAGMYLGGVDVAKDEKEYVKWIRKAAEKGNAQAMFGLGLAYELGQGELVRDRAMALAWYRRGAELGDPLAEKAVNRLEQ